MQQIYIYNPSANSFDEHISTNTWIEEFLNSYDEVEIISIMTGVPRKFVTYKGMSQIAKMMMGHKEFIGNENAELLIPNFVDWINILHSSPADILNNKEVIMAKKGCCSR